MGQLRDHEPVTFSEFNGLWRRGSKEETPLDHFQDSNNIGHGSGSSFFTRPGIDISQDVAVPLENVKRIYNYPTMTANTLIVLTFDGTDGEIFHVVNSTTVFGPILTITGMTDFAFLPYAGRGYISPFTTYVVGGLNQEKGLQGEFLYVYAGDGTPARKAAGDPMSPNDSLGITNGAAGHTDGGFHLFAFVRETISGALSRPGQITGFTTSPLLSVSFTNVQATGSPIIARRHLVATKVITNYNGDHEGYQFFFVPNATVTGDVITVLANISFFDADLLDDASHLIENFTEIPAGAVLTLYHERLVLCTTYDDISIGLVSYPGEPEAISEVEGLIIVTPDGNPITNAQELRDILYVYKRSKTVSFTDNEDVPSSWPLVSVDTSLGTCVHGIATVLDSGASSVDYLIVATYQGITLFNGRFINPELSWKIEDYWKALDRNDFRYIQIVNAPIQKEIYIILPTRQLLVCNYAMGMDPKKSKWEPWSFLPGVNTVAIFNIDEIILGADLV